MIEKRRNWWYGGRGVLLAAALAALALIPFPGFRPVRGSLLRRFRGERTVPGVLDSGPGRLDLAGKLDRIEKAAFTLWTDVFVGNLRSHQPHSISDSPVRRLIDRLLRAVPGGGRDPGPKWEIADVIYDEEAGKQGATVRSALSDRLSAIGGLALRPTGIDQVLGLEYRLIDSLILGHQQDLRLDEGQPVDPLGESRFYLRWEKEF